MKRNHVSEKVLRKEIDVMIECYTKELFSTFDKKEVIGIYLLGSTNKKWDSEIDYIPEMSDVDLNIYVKNPRKVEKYFVSISNALRFARNCEKTFIKKMPKHVHIPRLQAQLHNMFLDKYPNSLAPIASVKTIYGLPYEKTIPKNIQRDADNRKNILDNRSYLEGISLRVMSANSHRLVRYLNEIYYRVCSACSQILCMKGMNTDKVMCLNKTDVIKNLESKGYKQLAKEYRSMLKSCYEYSLNENLDTASNAILSGYNALQISIKIAQKSE